MITKIIPNISGTIYIPVTIFHIKDRTHVIEEAKICAVLSDSKYLGQIPTIIRAITDKNGRN